MAAASKSRKFLLRISNFRWRYGVCGRNRCFSSAVTSNEQYCINLVRRLDYENFLCTLLVDKHARASVFAVRGFNVELAQIQDAVSEKAIGKMRIQFWHDALDNIFKGNPPQQPVALCLFQAVKKHKLTKRWLSRLVEARESNLDDQPHQTVSALEDYGEQSVSPVLYLTLECLGVKDVQADHAASHLGKAIAIVTLLRATPFHGNKRKVYIPQDLMIKHGVSHEDIIRGSTSQSVKDVAFDIASLAHSHLEKARSLKPQVPKPAFRAFLPAVSCQAYLTAIQKADFDLFHPSLRQRNSLLPFHLLKNAWLRRY